MKRTTRPYTPADKEQLMALLRLNTPAYFHPSEESDLVEYLENHVEHYFVVEADGKILGSGGINYFAEKGEARISWDIIHPDHQGHGLGRELTQFRIDKIKEQPYWSLATYF